MFKLNNKTKESIYASTGMKADFIANTDIDKIDSTIESRIGKKLTFSTAIGGIISRGSVYLMFERFFTSKEIDRKLSKI